MSSNTSNTESETQNYNRNLHPLGYLKLYHEERMNQMDRNFVDMHKLENAIFFVLWENHDSNNDENNGLTLEMILQKVKGIDPSIAQLPNLESTVDSILMINCFATGYEKYCKRFYVDDVCYFMLKVDTYDNSLASFRHSMNDKFMDAISNRNFASFVSYNIICELDDKPMLIQYYYNRLNLLFSDESRQSNVFYEKYVHNLLWMAKCGKDLRIIISHIFQLGGKNFKFLEVLAKFISVHGKCLSRNGFTLYNFFVRKHRNEAKNHLTLNKSISYGNDHRSHLYALVESSALNVLTSNHYSEEPEGLDEQNMIIRIIEDNYKLMEIPNIETLISDLLEKCA